MKQTYIISNSPKKHLFFEGNFLKNIFDDNFLNEKDKALSPIVLSDEIQGEIDIKYGSNIEYIGSKIDDNNEEFHEILNEQICKIIDEKRFRNFVKNLLMKK